MKAITTIPRYVYIYILIHYLNFAFFSLTEDYFLYKVQKVNRSSKFSVSLKFNLDGSLRGHSMKFFPLFVLTWKPRFSGHLYGILKKEGKKINFSNTYYFISTVSSSRNNSKFAKKKKKFNKPFGKKHNRMSVKSRVLHFCHPDRAGKGLRWTQMSFTAQKP